MTIEKKRAVLEAAGIKVRANASEETVDRLYQEHANASGDDGGDDTVPDPEAGEESPAEVTISETPPLNPFTVADEIPARSPLNQPVAVKKGPDAIPLTPTMTEFWRFKNAHCDGSLGIKTPVVIEWARRNLPPDEYKALYDGKTLPI